ncbi:MAG TPA: hypothetical protein VFX18_03065 [Candidatus Nitrosocosmicus sp.]|nr:hypothetical protein [Candidatus Nitrosocosmicus sp.]
MLKNNFIENYYKHLDNLYERKNLNELKIEHFKKRGVQFYDTAKDLGCYNLSKILPYIVLGASTEYINKMSVPYQATSFVAGEVYSKNSGIYAYKIIGKRGGGIQLLIGGSRKLGDNVFASLHRILIGNQAIMVTINNMMQNHDQIWSWDFFAKHLIDNNPSIYKDLADLSSKFINKSKFHFIISIRTFKSIVKLNFIESYKNNKIAMLNPENNIKVIIITTYEIYNYLSKVIKESSLISYIITGDNFEMVKGLKNLRKEFGIKYLLNDGGRIMSNSIRDDEILAEERITLEPFNPITLDYTINSDCILGKNGSGIDNSEIQKAILLDSQNINDEKANIYIYSMDENKVL